ncbi:heme ABC exporter ATP-binding protein CcmA [Candidatus Puniceispirillum sp.]|uniref:heme ABC exporter ATP-binding protein CcmA n=1 Tax=Candidatus Puniceispirillum sp. TaxID=2026719 RepID=UPI001EC82265|nr:heme ABC exporter ATP-binding protein CcmA [Candidatus Puniceispirillum sp.]
MASDDTSMRMHSGLWLDAVTIMRGIRPVIHDFSNHLDYGQLGLVHGGNGAGKTTLLRAIAGRIPVASGIIRCAAAAGRTASGDAARLYVGHQDGLSSLMSGRENLQSWAAMTGYGDKQKIEVALAVLGCMDFADSMVRSLSRGQRRRLALARLMLGPETALWLLDEPNVGLDDDANDALARIICAHIGNGGMVLAATHLDLVAKLGTKRQIWTLGQKAHKDA